MHRVIPLADHPSHTDRTAKLVSGPHCSGRDIYQVRGGYIALIGHDHCLEGLFGSQQDAAAAQAEHR